MFLTARPASPYTGIKDIIVMIDSSVSMASNNVCAHLAMGLAWRLLTEGENVMKIIYELVEYCRKKKKITSCQIKKLLDDGFLDPRDYRDIIYPDHSWLEFTEENSDEDCFDAITDWFILDYLRHRPDPWIVGSHPTKTVRRAYMARRNMLRGGALNKFIPEAFRSLPSPLPIETLVSEVGRQCKEFHVCTSGDRWDRFVSILNFLYDADSSVLHDGLRKTFMKKDPPLGNIMQTLHTGDTLFPETFPADVSGPSVTALNQLLRENRHTEFESNRFSWVLKHKNIALLNRARLLRNRFGNIFRFWLLQFSEYESSCAFNQGNRCIHLNFGRSAVHLNQPQFIRQVTAEMRRWNIVLGEHRESYMEEKKK